MMLKKILTAAAAILFALLTLNTLAADISILRQTDGSVPERWKAVSSTIEEQVSKQLYLRSACIECSGLFSRLAGIRNVEGAYKLSNGQLSSRNMQTDPAPSAEAVISLRDYCEDHDMPFLYINLPHKPLSDEDLAQYGIESFTNRTQDDFLRILEEADVDFLDLREPVLSSFADPYDSFYRTDHHWTPEAGLCAAGLIADELETRYGLSAETELLDPALYKTTRYENCFLGEMGKKTGAAYAGTEDLIVVEPVFPTQFSLQIPDLNIDRTGDFSVFLNQNQLQHPSIHKDNLFYYYLFSNRTQFIHNENAANSTRILLIKDSFSQVVSPFLASGICDLVCWDVRYTDQSLREYIRDNTFDLVIVMYTGSHLKETEKIYRFD